MERNRLISSKDYGKTLKNVSDNEYRRLRDKYDIFLEQPIKEEMFFHLVSQPTVDSYMQPKEMKRQYDEWKSKYDNKLFDIDIDLSTVRHHKEQGRTIEYFCQFNNVKLTEKALNIIFGKTIT